MAGLFNDKMVSDVVKYISSNEDEKKDLRTACKTLFKHYLLLKDENEKMKGD